MAGIEAKQQKKKIDETIPQEVYDATIKYLAKMDAGRKIENVCGPIISWYFTPKKVSITCYCNGGKGKETMEYYQSNIVNWMREVA